VAIEASIQNYPDMGILLGILFVNASISFYETTKAGDAVAALKVRDWLAWRGGSRSGSVTLRPI
jgi:hypothetical protein